MERPAAYHSTPIFPPHTFRYRLEVILVKLNAETVYRPGDIARIEENVSGNGPTKKSVKTKKADTTTTSVRQGEGVVYKASY